MRNYLFPALLLIFASLACNLPGAVPGSPAVVDIPTFTPTVQIPEKPTDLPAPPTFTPEPSAPQPQVQALNPRSVIDCDIFLDASFSNAVGSMPIGKHAQSDTDKKACQYDFESGTIFVSITTSLPGNEAFQNVRQFDALSGATVQPYSLGEAAIFKSFGDGHLTLEAVLNGWYVVLDARGFDEKHLVLLAELLLADLAPYQP